MVVEVVYLPPIATELSTKLCIVIDVLRATSTLVSMFESGVRRITLAGSIEGALAQAGSGPGRPFVCGESGGLPPAGFDYGNSPREFLAEAVAGKELVFFTSNGTKAMRQVAASPVVLAGCLMNASAVTEVAVRSATQNGLDIAIICSGDHLGTHFAIDDAFTAGYLCSLIERRCSERGLPDSANGRRETAGRGAVLIDESGVAAMRLYRSYLAAAGLSSSEQVPPVEVVLEAFWESHNAQVLRQVGLAEDVVHCARVDVSRVVPRLRTEGDALVLYPEG